MTSSRLPSASPSCFASLRRGLGPTQGLGLALGLGLTGCSDPQAGGEPLTYHHDIKPIVERYCGSCHVAGGIAPFALSTYDELLRAGDSVRSAVSADRMPPWPPSADSRPLRGSRAMAQDHKQALLRWLDGLRPEGDASLPPRSDLPPPVPLLPARPDLVLDPGSAYAPKNSREDDYHCFIYDPKLTADRFLLAGSVHPDNQRIVHHVIAYEIPESDAALIRGKDTGGQGYTCFGAPGTTAPPVTLIGWAPGSLGNRMPEGTALRLRKGSLIVVQIHYNVIAGPGQVDRTTLDLELTDTPPQRELHALPLARPKQLMIPAGQADATQTVLVPLSALASFFKLPANKLTVYAHTPHMHLLGTRITTWLNNDLLLDLPRWNFHWQGAYQFETPYTATGSDLFKLECQYDNSAANQPLVDGVPTPPRDVTWGEGTRDEMCLNYLLLSAE